ncbi:hypothetical protein F4X88_20305 [Candidatus Poribacteria bacterium]|nr:hypothetical protein [Candidatus Poribacteria bacterium]
MRTLQAGLKNRIKPPPLLCSLHVSETLHWQFWCLLCLCCIVQAVQLTMAGYSHTKPYYPPDIPDSAKHERKLAAQQTRGFSLVRKRKKG